MKVIVKYQAQKGFKDKYTKNKIKRNDIIEVSIERMKELNDKNAGKVVDIILQDETDTEDKLEIDNNIIESKEETSQENEMEKSTYKKEDLEKMTVNQLKDLAEENKITLSSAKKTEIIEEILKNM